MMIFVSVYEAVPVAATHQSTFIIVKVVRELTMLMDVEQLLGPLVGDERSKSPDVPIPPYPPQIARDDPGSNNV